MAESPVASEPARTIMRFGVVGIVLTLLGVALLVLSFREESTAVAVAAAAMSRRAEPYTSMTWPCWSTARYTYRQVPATFM